MKQCVLDDVAMCDLKDEPNADDCMHCIFAGQYDLLEALIARLLPINMSMENAVVLSHLIEGLTISLKRSPRWFEKFRPQYWVQMKEQFDSAKKHDEEVQKRIKSMLSGEGKDAYRS